MAQERSRHQFSLSPDYTEGYQSKMWMCSCLTLVTHDIFCFASQAEFWCNKTALIHAFNMPHLRAIPKTFVCWRKNKCSREVSPPVQEKKKSQAMSLQQSKSFLLHWNVNQGFPIFLPPHCVIYTLNPSMVGSSLQCMDEPGQNLCVLPLVGLYGAERSCKATPHFTSSIRKKTVLFSAFWLSPSLMPVGLYAHHTELCCKSRSSLKGSVKILFFFSPLQTMHTTIAWGCVWFWESAFSIPLTSTCFIVLICAHAVLVITSCQQTHHHHTTNKS